MATFSSGSTIANELVSIQQVLNGLPDNSTGVIVPKNFRDGFYTLWENTILKPTTIASSTKEYIGIDSSQLSRSDVNWYPKFYIGQKQINNQTIMTDDLLSNSDVDVFFYTTKDTSGGDYNTKISILAGTSGFWQGGALSAPYLQSSVVSTVDGNYINFNLINSSYVTDASNNQYGGDINIKSEKNYVIVNDFHFPKSSEINSSKDGYVLKYRWISGKAYGFWEDAFSQSITSMVSSGTISIVGNPVIITGMKFSDSNIVATAIGGINAGETFSNVDLYDLLRRIIYTYVPPTLSTDILLYNHSTSLIEDGDVDSYNSLVLKYTISRNATYSIDGFDFEAGSPTYDGALVIASLIPDRQVTIGTVTPKIAGGPYLTPSDYYSKLTWTLSLSDTYITNVKSGSTLEIGLPFYYGTSETYTTQSTGLNSILGTGSIELNKLFPSLSTAIIGTPSTTDNKYHYITTNGIGAGMDGKGFIYFGYPLSYPELVQIKDQNGFEQQIGGTGGDFYTFSISINSPNSWWADKPYRFYISSASTSVPLSGNKWEFVFATSS